MWLTQNAGKITSRARDANDRDKTETRPRRDVGASRDRLETETSRLIPHPWAMVPFDRPGRFPTSLPLQLCHYLAPFPRYYRALIVQNSEVT